MDDSASSSAESFSDDPNPIQKTFEINQIVWAEWPLLNREDTVWWPCMIIDANEKWANLEKRKSPQHQYVVWLGDGTTSQLAPEKVWDFWEHFHECSQDIAQDDPVPSIIGSLIELSALRANLQPNVLANKSDADKIKWARQNAHKFRMLRLGEFAYEPLDKTKAVKDQLERVYQFNT